MTIETTYSQAREQLKSLMDRAVDDREIVLVRRRSGGDVAMIAADELESLVETSHLLRSSRNAERLLAALGRARSESLPATSLAALRKQTGLDGSTSSSGGLPPRISGRFAALGRDRSANGTPPSGPDASGAARSVRRHRQAGTAKARIQRILVAQDRWRTSAGLSREGSGIRRIYRNRPVLLPLLIERSTPIAHSTSNSPASCSMIVPPSCSTSMIVTARL